ncbi:SWIM zinc finger family protein [Amycolatopsis anabasis]|uniref:SWIM zinc finger family protein n=1 Tax=Amycolatopsis anabasis TaxID=1840409 RepID=UPI00131CF35B|nr:SWIM zinc finger family protein [Amycolatopsis anabasis]
MTYDERARSFPAFAARKRGRGRFAASWWGNAWIEALESESMDLQQLTTGRKYAYAGHVGLITVSPGRVAAAVHDGDPFTAYHAEMRFAELSAPEWERFLDRVAGRASHVAALLDRDVPQDLVESADGAGVRLLPGFGDFEPECDCPGWEHPCKHAAALAYQASWLLDADPFLLLLIRGRGERELLDELERRNTTAAREGVPAAEAYRVPVPPLPVAPPVVAASAAELRVPSGPGIDADELAALAAAAAERARALLSA